MKAMNAEGNIFIKYGLSLWCLGFCLLLCLSLADEIRTKENYKIGKVSSIVKEAKLNQNVEPLKLVS